MLCLSYLVPLLPRKGRRTRMPTPVAKPAFYQRQEVRQGFAAKKTGATAFKIKEDIFVQFTVYSSEEPHKYRKPI